MICLALGFWDNNGNRSGVHPVEQDLNPVREWLVIPMMLPLLHQWVCFSRTVNIVALSVHSHKRLVTAFPSSESCLAPFQPVGVKLIGPCHFNFFMFYNSAMNYFQLQGLTIQFLSVTNSTDNSLESLWVCGTSLANKSKRKKPFLALTFFYMLVHETLIGHYCSIEKIITF